MRNRTKRGQFYFLCICLMVVLSAAVPVLAAAEGTMAQIITVGVPVDRCPVFFVDADTGELAGIGIDLMRKASENAGFVAHFTPVTEPTLKEALDNEDYDVVMPFGSAIPSASGKATIVSENLLQTPFTLVAKSRSELPPLNELRVGMVKSVAAGAETVRGLYPGIEITLYDNMAECVRALRSHEVDALLHNSYVWSYVLQKPSYEDLFVLPSAMFSMDFRVGAKDTPRGREIIERLNGGIAMLTDTQRQAVTLDYAYRRLYQYDFSDYLYQYGLILLGSALIIAGLIVIVVLKQRTYRLEQEEKMREMMDHDPLTGLLNMNGFRKRVEHLLHTYSGNKYFLSYNNIKNFKYVNDSMGMEAGDDLLRFWAEKSLEALSDQETVGRIGNDHLAVFRIVGGEERILEDERNIVDPVRNYFVDRGREKKIQVCSGIYVLMPEDYKYIDVDHMLDCARVAEKKVRDTRKDGYEFYNPNQWEKGKKIADIVGLLPGSLQSGEILVWYQPQVNFTTGEITGLEALCRWNHAKLGWLQPGEFIPILEESGLIYQLDSYVWDRVCQDLKRWNEQGIHRSVSVNLSRSDIEEDRNIPGHFFDLIQKYGLGVDQLRIEITETAFVEDADLLLKTTVKLREFGFQVEMDDFGSGYSSLHMLKEVPVDRIKMDLHFLTGTGDPERGRIIISYMIQMVDSLGMNLIAEGVENVAQARFLQSRGCCEMQGFYFYKPMSVQEFEEKFGQEKTC